MEINQVIQSGYSDSIELANAEYGIVIRLVSNKNYSTLMITKEQGNDLLEKLKEVYKNV